MVALGAATMVAALPAVPASGAEALAPPTAAPPDEAGTPGSPNSPGGPSGPSGPSAELPRTVTGHDGFVVLGLALAAIGAVALVTAVSHRPGPRRRRRRPHEMW
jgi:hypothetical protein